MNDTLLTVKEVARTLKVDEGTVRYWIRLKLIKHVSLPVDTTRPAYRVWKSTVDELVIARNVHQEKIA